MRINTREYLLDSWKGAETLSILAAGAEYRLQGNCMGVRTTGDNSISLAFSRIIDSRMIELARCHISGSRCWASSTSDAIQSIPVPLKFNAFDS
jgi:hypothetical protein